VFLLLQLLDRRFRPGEKYPFCLPLSIFSKGSQRIDYRSMGWSPVAGSPGHALWACIAYFKQVGLVLVSEEGGCKMGAVECKISTNGEVLALRHENFPPPFDCLTDSITDKKTQPSFAIVRKPTSRYLASTKILPPWPVTQSQSPALVHTKMIRQRTISPIRPSVHIRVVLDIIKPHIMRHIRAFV
jgi:hypothetical protein